MGAISSRPDNDIVVGDRLDELIERGAQGTRERDELVDRNAPMPGFDAAQRRRTHVAAGGQRVQRPASGQA